jgi:hypothetical protein
MKIYKSEHNIAGLILNSRSISYCTELSYYNKAQFINEAVQNFATANKKLTKDLYPVTSILVSTVWNTNDDVFLKDEVWNARHTPIHHPVNINHDQDIIVGHMTDIWAVDDHGEIIPEDTAVEDLPAIYSLVNASVVYTSWYEEEKSAQVMELINSIEENKMFVSMECIFEDFDYVLSNAKEYKVVKRTEETADMSKHLRCFGGNGLFGDYRVGRAPRGILFTGKGFTTNPANKRSIIFTNIPAPSDHEDGVQSLVAHVLENKQMSDTIQTDLDTLKQEFAALSASFEALKSEKEALAILLEENKSKAQLELEVFQKENSELKASIDSLKLEYQTLTRKTELTSEGLSQDKASASAKLYINLTDEQWVPVKEALVAAVKNSTSTVINNGTQTPQQVLASVEPVDNTSKAQVNVDTTTPSKEEEYSELQKIIANLINVNIDGDKK